GLAPASPARAATPNPHNPKFTGNGVARMAAEAAIRGTTSGTVTGVVRGITGAPVRGACITATGSAGSRTVISRPNGEYALRNLQPGRYALRVAGCGARGSLGGRLPAGYAWPGLPPVVTVLPGRVRMLTPARVWQADAFGLAGGRAPAEPVSVAASAL